MIFKESSVLSSMVSTLLMGLKMESSIAIYIQIPSSHFYYRMCTVFPTAYLTNEILFNFNNKNKIYFVPFTWNKLKHVKHTVTHSISKYLKQLFPRSYK